jgi:hypothetical protein
VWGIQVFEADPWEIRGGGSDRTDRIYLKTFALALRKSAA